ncbi:glycosyltransferase family 4 protein [Solirubrobacter sp. CPCC 204708]|uniref:Glycosyltransferase family 4 protein n=1 Tax=Solirubrobacter deserti TaxID=2282478 RepID=A0ABT4RJ93_9ACTN|nr:glycosyltransferase family 4 protein [Solirubrobacter deserti]MBE2317665.1 glycosyltransferase family 4 protein [Solirubrobacter deserti]MDA0138615.1 glycosyltransferase family 4 protein [Solirubrobacter deserti]
MRILCVGTDYPPERRGGYELQCAGFAAHARAHGHVARVLCAGRGERDGDVARTLRRFPVVPQPTSPEEAWRAEAHNARAFERELERVRPDVVCWWRLGELSMSLLRRADVPTVGVVCDGWMLDGPERDPWARMTRRAPAFHRSRWLFVSEHLRARVGGDGRVVHAGIEPLAPADERAWDGRLLYAGRVSPLKGIDVAIRALAQLPGMRLDIVGDGAPDYLADLRALARAAGVAGRVRFAASVPREALRERYAAADAVLFPVRWDEPFGLVPLEAMAVGRPVVATGRGGSAEYLRDGENALLAPSGDVAATAAAVRALAEHAPLRRALVAAGRKTAAAFPAAKSHAAVLAALEAAARPRAVVEEPACV